MIPSIEVLEQDLEEANYYNNTYKIVKETEDEDIPSRVNGYVDDLEAVKQAIYLILSTERYAHPIYSWDYGVELVDLFGKPISYVMSEIPRRIEEALTMDDRIESCQDFEFEKERNKLHVTFTAVTNVGNIKNELEVDI